MKTIVVECPTCKTSIAWNEEARYRPFCSKRCKLIDLGEWASEKYKIAGNPVDPTSSANETSNEEDII
jgi:endogenous inhibitor of DNA gyrase (YacG/DUF329 family)